MKWANAVIGVFVQTALLGGLALFVEGRDRLAADLLLLLFLLLAGALCGGEALLSDHAGVAPEEGRLGERRHGSARLTGLLLLLLFALVIIEHGSRNPGASLPVIVVSVLCGASGIVLRLVAIRRLGRFFLSEIQIAEGQPLIQSGPFRLVRHPSESGLLLSAAACCVLLGSVTGALVWVLGLLPATLFRIRQEERLLQDVFGESFDAYRKRVPSLIPGL